MKKNISQSALTLKQKIISTLKTPLFQPPSPLQSDCKELCKDLLQDIKVNTDIINQIQYIDRQIQQLQLNIAELQQQYNFVSEIQSNEDSRLKDVDWEQTKEVQFLKQRDIKSRLLRHLESVEKATKSIGYQQILGLSEKRVIDHSRKHCSEHFKYGKYDD